MNWHLSWRRNRFKNKPKVEQPRWQGLSRGLAWRRPSGRAASVVLLAGGLAALPWALDRPVRVISMDGSFQRVSPGQIEKAVAPFSQAGFMSADLDGIQRAVEALPWVERARIQRRWPNSLHVTVIEHTAAARWGEAGLLTTRGQPLMRAVVPAYL